MFEKQPNLEPKNLKEAQGRKKQQELYFRSLIESRLIESFIDKFKNLNYDQKYIKKFRENLTKLSDNDLSILIATPWTMKNIVLEKKQRDIESGKMSVDTLVNFIISKNKEFGRAYAYHTSNINIKPEPAKGAPDKNRVEWSIQATEEDHRDNDLPRAYMSFDYQHLYRTKNPKYLYIVSYRKGENTGYVSNSRENWGRAYGLDIIDKVDLKEIDHEINTELNKQKGIAQENEKAQAA